VGVHHPFIAPLHLQSLPYCNTIARPLRNIRLPPNDPFLYAIHHTILVIAIPCKGLLSSLSPGLIAFDLVMDLHMDLLYFGAQATLGSAEIVLSFKGQPFGILNTQPCPLGGGGKIKTQVWFP